MSLMSLSVGSADLQVSRVSGREALSTLFSFEVRAATGGSPPALADLIGQPFTLTLNDRFDRALSLHGVVTAVDRTTGATSGGSFSLMLGPEVEKLTVGRCSRVYQDMTAVDIIKKVLEDGGIPSDKVRWATSGSFPTRPYCVQYRESDWTFIERLLAEEGIYYWFEHTDDATTLVLADDSTAAPELDEGASIPYHDDDALHATSDALMRVGRAHRIVHDAVRLRDYNFEKPRLKLDSKAGSGTYERFDFPGRFGVPADGDKRASNMLEALRARRVELTAETSSTRVRAGLIMEMTDHPIDALNARYLVTSVAYEGKELRVEGAGARGITLRVSAIPADTMFRPTRARVTESSGGPQTGVVAGASGEEIHPDKTGRIRVQTFWDREGKRDDKASTWMRVGQFALGGSMVIPRIGWEVIIGHYEDDIDGPYVIHHLYDGTLRPPYALPANKTRTAWQTATTPGGGSTNEVRFEDKAGSEEMFINASKDMNIVIGDNKTEKVNVNHDVTIGSNLDTKIGSNFKIGIKSNQDVSIGASETTSVSGGRLVNIVGSETVSIGASRTLTVSSGSTLEAKGGKSLTVGGSMIGASALGVNRAVLGSLSVSVGGAWISAAATGVANATGGAAAETIGGAKIQAGASGCQTSVKGALAETVGGAYVIAAGSNAGESAKGKLAITVGGAFLGNAPSIEIEAESEISILCGGSSITIKGSSVEVKAPTIAAPGATIKKKASTIKHN